MKQLINIVLIALLTGIATWFLPWWMIAVIPFLYVVFFKVSKPFMTGFLSIILLWLVWILVKDIPNEHILSMRMTKVFGLPHYSILIIVNIVLGGLIGGLGAYCGGRMNKAFSKQ